MASGFTKKYRLQKNGVTIFEGKLSDCIKLVPEDECQRNTLRYYAWEGKTTKSGYTFVDTGEIYKPVIKIRRKGKIHEGTVEELTKELNITSNTVNKLKNYYYRSEKRKKEKEKKKKKTPEEREREFLDEKIAEIKLQIDKPPCYKTFVSDELYHKVKDAFTDYKCEKKTEKYKRQTTTYWEITYANI